MSRSIPTSPTTGGPATTGAATRLGRRSFSLALVGAAAAACGESSSDTAIAGGSQVDVSASAAAADAVELSMAINSWVGYGPWYVAKSRGFDAAHGVNLTFVDFIGNKDLYAAVASGRLDATHALVSTALTFQASKVPVKVALFLDTSEKADGLLAAAGITSVEGLRGRKVACEEGGGHEILLRLALQKVGMTLQDVQFTPLAAGDAGTALISGQVDAAVTYEPYITQTLKNSPGSSLIVAAGDFPGVIADVWEISEDFASKNPDAVTGALAAWNDGVEYFRSNPDDALKIMADVTDSDVEELKTSLAGVTLYDAADSLAYLQSEFVPLAEEIQGIMLEQGTLEGDTDPATLSDTSFLEEV